MQCKYEGPAYRTTLARNATKSKQKREPSESSEAILAHPIIYPPRIDAATGPYAAAFIFPTTNAAAAPASLL